MVELVDTPDLKSCALLGVRVQVPPSVQMKSRDESLGFFVSRKAEKYILTFWRETKKRTALQSCFSQNVETGLTEGNSRHQYIENP